MVPEQGMLIAPNIMLLAHVTTWILRFFRFGWNAHCCYHGQEARGIVTLPVKAGMTLIWYLFALEPMLNLVWSSYGVLILLPSVTKCYRYPDRIISELSVYRLSSGVADDASDLL